MLHRKLAVSVTGSLSAYDTRNMRLSPPGPTAQNRGAWHGFRPSHFVRVRLCCIGLHIVLADRGAAFEVRQMAQQRRITGSGARIALLRVGS